jgi:hypothetical protein
VIEAISFLLLFVVLVVLAFGASVRVGMLVGRRMDRALEARAAAAAIHDQNPISNAIRGPEDYHDE